MRENASRYRPPGRADVYWRRRVFALAVGLAVVALISWAVNGTLSTPASAPAAASGAAGAGGPGAGGGAGPPGGGHVASQAGPSTGTRGGQGGRAGGQTSAAGRARRQPGRPRPRRGQSQSHPGRSRHRGHPDACPPGEVVLSLHQPRATYRGRAWPEFEADVVSTAAQPCTFDTGSRHLSVVVRSGRQPLWDSAACAGGTGSSVTVLTKGVPAVLHFWWNRRTSPSGCRGHGRPVKPGTFVATAVSGHMISNSLIFVLRAPGVAVP